MSLHILYGSSLSGRAEKLYDTVFRRAEQYPDRTFIVLVPEQASLTVQQALVERSPRHALLNIDVLTFNRLCYRVFEETGEKGRDILDDIGKSMLLRLIVSREQKELTALKRNLKRRGFIDELKSLMSEFAQYNVSPERLLKSADQLSDHPLLQAKTRDVALLYGEFLDLLHENYEMAEERLMRLASCIRRWSRAKDTEFILEGFTGFTPPQYEVLSAILMCCPELYLGAVMGTGRTSESEKNKENLFYMSAHMAALVKERGIEHSLAIEEETLFGEEIFSPEIRHIERHFGQYPIVPYPEKTGRVQISCLRNREAETEAILSRVLQAVRDGYAYRDLAIICGDPAAYRELLEARFGEAGIPLFFDAVKPLTANPLLSLLTETLGVLVRDFSREDVIAFGKNPLVESYLQEHLLKGDSLTAYERVCELENFLFATGLRGHGAYGKTWISKSRKYASVRKDAVNELKDLLGQPLCALREKTAGETAVSEKVIALRELFGELGVREAMLRFSEKYEAEGDLLLAREYENTYDLLEGLFDRTLELLGDRVMDCEEFLEVMETGLEKLGLGLIPPTKDRLVVGDLERSRLGDIKKLFILGANEGVLPVPHAEGGLFSDADRELLTSGDLELAPNSREAGFNQQFYLYLLLTKPRETVFITWSAMDVKGKALLRSPVVETLEKLFPLREDPGRAFTVNTRAGGLRTLAAGLREAEKDGKRPDPMIRALFQWFNEAGPDFSGLSQIGAGMDYRYKKEKLPEDLARKLFSEHMNGSATGLEEFANCAFAHFLDAGLHLRERDEHVVTGADIGTILHNSVDAFFKLLRESGLQWIDLTDEKLLEMTERAVAAVTDSDDLLTDNARNSYLIERVKRLTRRTLLTLRHQWQQGQFTESLTEETYSAEAYPELELKLGQGMALALRGRIDRLDLSEDGTKVYVKVIDYKSGNVTPDFTKIYYGLQLQLLLYMEAAKAIVRKRCPGKEIVPVGFYYYHFDDPIVEEKEGKDPGDQILMELRMSGVTNPGEGILEKIDGSFREPGAATSDVVRKLRRKKDGEMYDEALIATTEEMNGLGAFALKKAESLAGNILSGNIEVRPKSSGGKANCGYCIYKGVCGFDEKIRGFRGEEMKPRGLQDLLTEMREGKEEDRDGGNLD